MSSGVERRGGVGGSGGCVEVCGSGLPGILSKFSKGEDSCTSSSSIGKNSDLIEEEEGGDASKDEVQSKFKGGGFDSLQALEEVLPMRRGISSFYSGKSKSFASLSCVTSVKEIAKAENAYSRKRRNLMASASHVWDRNRRSMQLLRSSGGGGIQKRSLHASRSTLALGVAMSRSSSSDSNSSSEESGCSQSRLPPIASSNHSVEA